MTERRRGAAVGARRIDDRPERTALVAGAAFLILVAFTVAARAETVITAHGISTFGDLKYPADFAHLDYVNPDAPKGGEISQWAFGGFDSMNPYSVKGRAGQLSSAMYESILTATADEIGAT
jgi:microcin C transport system substrate-binding protein